MSDMPTLPADLAEVIATHSAMFGGFTMSADVTEVPQQQTPTPGDVAQRLGQQQSQQQDEQKPAEFTDDETGEKYGFPAKTPLSEMDAEQRAEYWRHKARKHEDRNRESGRSEDRGKDHKGDQQQDPDAIRKDAERAALARYAPVAVKAEFKAAFGDRRTSDQVDAIISTLDLSKFLTSKGEVDADKVIQTADAIAPKGGGAGTSGPDMGQGNRGTSHISKAEAGRLAAERRHGKK